MYRFPTGGLFAHDISGAFSTSRSYMTNVYKQNTIWNAFESIAGGATPGTTSGTTST